MAAKTETDVLDITINEVFEVTPRPRTIPDPYINLLIIFSYQRALTGGRMGFNLTIYFAQYNIDAAQNGYSVRNLIAFAHPLQRGSG